VRFNSLRNLLEIDLVLLQEPMEVGTGTTTIEPTIANGAATMWSAAQAIM